MFLKFWFQFFITFTSRGPILVNIYIYYIQFGILAKVGLIHMGVFLILLLSGERNFGVRLNKPFTSKGLINIPLFTGTHADLLIIVKI